MAVQTCDRRPPPEPPPTASRPLRVGIVTEGLEERDGDGTVEIANGGIGEYIHQLIIHLRRVDPASTFVPIRRGGGRLDLYSHPGTMPGILPRSRFGRLAGTLDRSYARVARALDLDLIHFPNQVGGLFLPRVVRRVVTVHDLTPLLLPRHHPLHRVLAHRLLLGPSLRAADHVIVDSINTRADVLGRRLAPAAAVSVVPLGVAEIFRPDPRTVALTLGHDLPERFILSVGVFEPRKNHALLVRALAHLHRQGERVGLVIAGRDGWGRTDPLAAAAAAGVRDHVRVLRNVSAKDLVALYNRAAVFAYPSLYEGFGLPVLEAMACGTPVVASNTSSLPEVAADAALLVDPHDARAFAAQLAAVLRDPALCARLVAAGHRRAAEHPWARTAAETLAVYRRVCARPPG